MKTKKDKAICIPLYIGAVIVSVAMYLKILGVI